MTVREALDMAGEEAWIRVRPHGEIRWAKDVVLWSGNWRSGDYPMGLGKYLDWRAGDLSAEKHPDPLGRKYPGDGLVPMLVVCAYRRGAKTYRIRYRGCAKGGTPDPEDDPRVGQIYEWTLEQILHEINRDRGELWAAYDETDWREGLDEWTWYELVEGEG